MNLILKSVEWCLIKVFNARQQLSENLKQLILLHKTSRNKWGQNLFPRFVLILLLLLPWFGSLWSSLTSSTILARSSTVCSASLFGGFELTLAEVSSLSAESSPWWRIGGNTSVKLIDRKSGVGWLARGRGSFEFLIRPAQNNPFKVDWNLDH